MTEQLSLAISKMASLVSNWKSEYIYLQVSESLASEITTLLDSNKTANTWTYVGTRPITSCFVARDGRYLIKLGKPEVFFE